MNLQELEKYLTCEEILPSDPSEMIKEALGKALQKQTETIEDKGKKLSWCSTINNYKDITIEWRSKNWIEIKEIEKMVNRE